ncbi:MAG: bifunctional lysylphosphatidylglycerol flippase/synthetase MprF [Lysobacterales bacterium]|jgi:phosphatidylglycerol lysyltransferase
MPHWRAPFGGRARSIAGAVVSLLILGASLWFLHHEFKSLQLQDIVVQMRSIPLAALLAAGLFTAGSYVVLTGYDTLAMRYIGHKLDYVRCAQTAFMAFAVGQNVGFAALSGGSIRYRMYSLQGLSGFDIAKVIVFVSTTFVLGAALLLGTALLVLPVAAVPALGLSEFALHAIGLFLLAIPAVYLALAGSVSKPLTIGKWMLSFPRPGIGLAQVFLSVIDLMLSAATLYVLIGPELPIGFFPFLGIYLVAMSAGLVSSIPGGIGVFEAIMLVGLPGVDRSVLLGSVLVYRVIYYVLPLCFALLLLTINEIKQHRSVLVSSSGKVGGWLSAIVPQVVSVAVFLAGVVLLVSGATPAVVSRLNFIARGIPLPVLELSHLAGSVLGVGLLVLARGLARRLRGAYFAALLVLAGGVVVSLLKGLDFEEAATLSIVFLVLRVSRDEFYRRGSVASQQFTTGWVASIVLALGFVFWVGLVSFRQVSYSNDLWWQFALHADAPRMLRASLVAGITAMSMALWKVFHAGRKPLSALAPEGQTEQVRNIVRDCKDACANAALTGDKLFHFSPSGKGFIMYRQTGRSWIALGDPVGPESEWDQLVWSFREMVDRYDGRGVFYKVSAETLPLYLDMGMSLAKIGEDARVDLDEFGLEGKRNAKFRYARNKALKEGALFEVVPAKDVADIAAELRAVSNAWLDEKGAGEKGFSLGSFSGRYVSQFDCAVVRLDGAIVAFANLWQAPRGGELSVDLMRFNRNAPNGIMDFLFVELMLWAKAGGYAWFDLGMAPLSGLDQHALAPLWHKLGNLIFSHGEGFYNFEGLRTYKEKFNPLWRPRYIACPQGLMSLPRALLDTARLISGGYGKLLEK